MAICDSYFAFGLPDAKLQNDVTNKITLNRVLELFALGSAEAKRKLEDGHSSGFFILQVDWKIAFPVVILSKYSARRTRLHPRQSFHCGHERSQDVRFALIVWPYEHGHRCVQA